MYKFHPYFLNSVLKRRPYLTKEICIRIVESSIDAEEQEDGRFRFWGFVPELGTYLRVITEADLVTIFNAFKDPDFNPKF